MTGVLQLLGKMDCEIDIDTLFRGHTMDSVDITSFINKVLTMAQNLKKDEQARGKAQSIAFEGFEAFKTAVDSVK
jgi:hypothetical protein